jgi:hypothetical protein
MDKTDDERGLYDKYTVINNETGQPVDYRTFTLKPDSDRHAALALLTYGVSCRIENPALSDDLMIWAIAAIMSSDDDPVVLQGHGPGGRDG